MALVHVLLDEQELTLDEIAERGHERFGFEKRKIRFEAEMILGYYGRDGAELLSSGKYRMKEGFLEDVLYLLEHLPDAPEGYFEKNPPMKRLYDVMKARYGRPHEWEDEQ